MLGSAAALLAATNASCSTTSSGAVSSPSVPTSSTSSATTPPSVAQQQGAFYAGEGMYLIAMSDRIYPSRDGRTAASDLAIVAVPPNGGPLVQFGKVLDPLGYQRTSPVKLTGNSFDEKEISSKGDRWFAVIDLSSGLSNDHVNVSSNPFTVTRSGTGVIVELQESSLSTSSGTLGF